MSEKIRFQGLTANALKFIAIIAMTCDHISMEFISEYSIWGQALRVIGRLTIGIFCYMIAEGFYHTHNIKKYLFRIFIFAVISHIPFIFLNTGKVSFLYNNEFFYTSVMWPLFLGLVSLCVWNSNKINKVLKIVILVLLCTISNVGDGAFMVVLWIWGFWIFRNNKKKQMLFYSSIALMFSVITAVIYGINSSYPWYKEAFQFGLLCTIPVLLQYNGRPGMNKRFKWFFYIYYPLHMLVIAVIAHGI